MNKYILTVMFDDKLIVGLTSQTYQLNRIEDVFNIIKQLEQDLGRRYNIKYSYVVVEND